MIILITGTPGTGKSTLSQYLSAKLSMQEKSVKTVLVNDLIKSEKLYEEYDSHFDTYIIDDRKVRRFLDKYLEDVPEDYCIIETHTVTTLPKKVIDIAFVLNSRTDILFDRLKSREYSQDKINENMECEIMKVILEEAVERFGANKTHELSSNTLEDIEDNIEVILDLIK